MQIGRHCAAVGVCVALAVFAATPCWAANTFEEVMHAVSVPEIHIRPYETPIHDAFTPSAGVACEAGAGCSNRTSFALHAKNLTAFELVDLICFLSDNAYAFGENGLSIAATNAPATSRKQDATQEKALVARMKAIVIPEVTFRPPATIVDAVDFFYQARRGSRSATTRS